MSKNKIIETITKLNNKSDKDNFFIEQLTKIIKNDKKSYRNYISSHQIAQTMYSFQSSLHNTNPLLAIHFEETKYKIFQELENNESIDFSYPNKEYNFNPFKNMRNMEYVINLPEQLSVKTRNSSKHNKTYQGEITAFEITEDFNPYCTTDIFDNSKNKFIKNKNADCYTSIKIEGSENERLVFDAQVSFPIELNWVIKIIDNNLTYTAQPWNDNEQINALLLSKKENKTEEELKSLYLSGYELSDNDKIKMYDIDNNSLYSFNLLSKKTAKYFSKNVKSLKEIYFIQNKFSEDKFIDQLTFNFLERQENITLRDFINDYTNPLRIIKNRLTEEGKSRLNKLAIESDPNNLRYLKEEEQTTDLVLSSVKNNASSLRFVKNKTLEVCKVAVLNKKTSLKHVPEKFINEINIILENQKNEKKKLRKRKI